MRRLSATNVLILIIFIVFGLEIVFQQRLEEIFSMFGFSVKAFLSGNILCMLTCIFLHGSFEHLFFNSLGLFFFGNILEEEIGPVRTLAIFFFSAIFGELVLVLLAFLGLYPANIPTIGASAGIFGLIGAAMILRPFALVSFPYILPLPVVVIAVLYIVSNILLFLSQVVYAQQSQIAYAAHIAGAFCGIVIGMRLTEHNRAMIAMLILLILAFLPVILSILSKIQVLSYANIISGVFGK